MANQIAAYFHVCLEPKNQNQDGECPSFWWVDKGWSYICYYFYKPLVPGTCFHFKNAKILVWLP